MTTLTLPSLPYKQQQRPKLQSYIQAIPEEIYIPTPTKWQEDNRYIAPEISPEHYGQFDRETAPQWIEPLNRMHPDDPATHIAIMKSVQSAATVTLAEGAMGFATRYKLGSCLYLTANKGVGKIRSSAAFDPLIDDAGLSDMLKPISNRTKRKSSDTMYYKEFAGGIKWLITSYNSIGDLKSNTFQFLVLDEWDEAPAEVDNQGDLAGIIEGRTLGVRFFKILMISTSSDAATSRIWKSYLEGDQRKFFVPCPLCGGTQELELKGQDQKHGLTFSQKKDERTGARILDDDSVRYICRHCEREFFEPSKKDICIRAANGEGGWKPTWESSDYRPKSPHHRSYFAGGLISPFLSWARVCERFIGTKFGEDLLALKDFKINVLGGPWQRVVTSKSWEDLRDKAEDYVLGTVPDGGLRIYGGVDVQGDRLEMAVWAVGAGMEKWLVDYQIWYGNPATLKDNTWASLHQYAYAHKFGVVGAEVEISKIAVDCGWDPQNNRPKDWQSKAHTVFCFIALRLDKFIAVRGAGELKESMDIVKSMSIKNAPISKRWDVNSSIIKEMIMRYIDIPRGPQAMHFPAMRQEGGVKRAISEDFFRGFLSERYQEISKGRMGWKRIYRSNEPLDTTTYAIAAMYVDGMHYQPDNYWDAYREGLLT